jgi:hypothetical protein
MLVNAGYCKGEADDREGSNWVFKNKATAYQRHGCWA